MKCEYIDHMGSDLTVVNSARVSMNKESEWELEPSFDNGYISTRDLKQKLSDKDVKLINYLAKHNHFTPFTHAMITLRETVPIFVARQRFKHMVGFTYNEVSRRYVDDEPEFYFPNEWRSRPEGSVKQGSGNKSVESMWYSNNVECWEVNISDFYNLHCEQSLNIYNSMINAGVAPEQARMVLPQSMYTSYYVTGSLAAFARAYKQRIDAHAQYEIQLLAKQWDELITPLFPVSWAALKEV